MSAWWQRVDPAAAAAPEAPARIARLHARKTAHYVARVAQGEHVKVYETVRSHRDGRAIEVSISAGPIVGADGRVVALARFTGWVGAQTGHVSHALAPSSGMRQYCP